MATITSTLGWSIWTICIARSVGKLAGVADCFWLEDLEEETIFEDGEMVTFDKAALTVLRDCLRLTNDGKLA